MPANDRVEIEFTKHATDKFGIFRKHNLKISRRFVTETVRKPELRDDESRKPLRIAISELDSEHYLSVRRIITFYPARKERYEGKI
jgi:hypothetical protein